MYNPKLVHSQSLILTIYVGVATQRSCPLDRYRPTTALRGVERWSSLTYVKKKLIESKSQELTRWPEIKSQERETSRREFYIPRLKRGMSGVLGSTAKKYASRYLQLKVGHGAVGTPFAKIGVIETPQMLVV